MCKKPLATAISGLSLCDQHPNQSPHNCWMTHLGRMGHALSHCAAVVVKRAHNNTVMLCHCVICQRHNPLKDSLTHLSFVYIEFNNNNQQVFEPKRGHDRYDDGRHTRPAWHQCAAIILISPRNRIRVCRHKTSKSHTFGHSDVPIGPAHTPFVRDSLSCRWNWRGVTGNMCSWRTLSPT